MNVASPDPSPTRIEIVEGAEVVIAWDDGTSSSLGASDLRAACQCAGCREDEGRRQTELVLGGPVPVTVVEAKLVGGYALSFVFAPDGHGTGIYPFGLLYELGRSSDSI